MSMLIGLDTKDLITLERSKRSSGLQERFAEMLRTGGHNLVLTYSNIAELSTPRDSVLWTPRKDIPPATFLRYLDGLPRIFVRNPIEDELRAAVSWFGAGKPYRQIDPFRSRFDQILADNPATAVFVNLSLDEIVYRLQEMSRRKVLDPYREYVQSYGQLIRESRARDPKPNRRQHFTTVISRNLRLFGLSTQDDVKFADWIWRSPGCCPALCLSYELYWSAVDNVEEKLDGNILADRANLLSVPYVDLATADKAARGQIERTAMGSRLKPKFCVALEDVISRL